MTTQHFGGVAHSEDHVLLGALLVTVMAARDLRTGTVEPCEAFPHRHLRVDESLQCAL